MPSGHVGIALDHLYCTGVRVTRAEVVAADLQNDLSGLADDRLRRSGVRGARLIVARVREARFEDTSRADHQRMIGGDIVRRDAAVSGMLGGAVEPAVFEVLSNETVRVVAN